MVFHRNIFHSVLFFPYIWKDRYASKGDTGSWIALDKNAKVSFVDVSQDLRENNALTRVFCPVAALALNGVSIVRIMVLQHMKCLL